MGDIMANDGDLDLRSLNDGQAVVIGGEVVRNVPVHPAFRGVCRTVADLYDSIAAGNEL